MRRGDADRQTLACRRLLRVLGRHGVATARTLEQKISDAGPGDQRIDPHVLTRARRQLIEEGEVVRLLRENAAWFHLASTPEEILRARMNEQLPVFREVHSENFTKRVGQALEIAIFKALMQQDSLVHFGGFADLEDHDDSTLYSKEDPPRSLSGRRLPGRKQLDFICVHRECGGVAVEAKNVRPWLYPHQEEVVDLIAKAVALDCVPVLVARRIPFVTFRVLLLCGVVMHQTYNQLYPAADHLLAARARDRRLLGYHDIRVGNQPDARLVKFISANLPRVLPGARERFDQYKDLLADFGDRTISYREFAARVRRRSQGADEDSDIDWDELSDFI